MKVFSENFGRLDGPVEHSYPAPVDSFEAENNHGSEQNPQLTAPYGRKPGPPRKQESAAVILSKAKDLQTGEKRKLTYGR
jgi:hypothetical protein